MKSSHKLPSKWCTKTNQLLSLRAINFLFSNLPPNNLQYVSHRNYKNVSGSLWRWTGEQGSSTGTVSTMGISGKSVHCQLVNDCWVLFFLHGDKSVDICSLNVFSDLIPLKIIDFFPESTRQPTLFFIQISSLPFHFSAFLWFVRLIGG